MMLPFNFAASSQRADAGEKLISSVATTAIRALLSGADDLQVSIYCQPVSKLLQGAIDNFTMKSKGMLIKNQFRAESVRVDTDAIALDLGAVLGGKVRLLRPTEAIASVVLLEEDINRSFEAELVTKKLQGISLAEFEELDRPGETASFTRTRIELLDDNHIRLRTQITFEQSGETGEVAFTARMGVVEQRRLVLEEPVFEDDSPQARKLGQVFVDQFNRMMDLDKFNLDGVILRIHRLRVRNRQLIFEGRAKINHFPEPRKR